MKVEKKSFTVGISKDVNERFEKYLKDTGTKKYSVVEQALHLYLVKRGY